MFTFKELLCSDLRHEYTLYSGRNVSLIFAPTIVRIRSKNSQLLFKIGEFAWLIEIKIRLEF